MKDWSTATIGIATKHQKERVLVPLLRGTLGASVMHVPFDTDQFGTFSGEIPRPGDQTTTLKAKVRGAALTTEARFIVGSEGAISSHPLIPSAGLAHELVTIYDREADVFVYGRHTGILPHIHSGSVRRVAEVSAVLKRFDYPTHQVILKNHPTKPSAIIKDMGTEAELRSAAEKLLRWPWQRVYLETDVRADRHPERMALIEKAGEDLVANLLRECPQCSRGGFSPTRSTPGLPCSTCSTPTDMPQSTTYSCPYCHHEQSIKNETECADSATCPRCNP